MESTSTTDNDATMPSRTSFPRHSMDVIYLNRSMESPASIGSRDGAILFSSETRHLRATLKLKGGVRPMKDDALAPSVNDNHHGGAFFHESDGTNNEPGNSVVSAAANDTSASARSRIHSAVWHVLIVVASSSLLMHS